MQLKYRIANENDFVQLVVLFKEFAVFENLSDKMTNSVSRMTAEKEFFKCYVAETHDGKIVGFATYFFCYYSWVGKSMYLDDLYVTPAFRGKGIGSALINKIVSFAKSSGCHRMRWQVSSWNIRAIEFYTRLGAEVDAIERNCTITLDA